MFPVIRIHSVLSYKGCLIVIYRHDTGSRPPSIYPDLARIQVVVEENGKPIVIPDEELFWSDFTAICAGRRIVNQWYECKNGKKA